MTWVFGIILALLGFGVCGYRLFLLKKSYGTQNNDAGQTELANVNETSSKEV